MQMKRNPLEFLFSKANRAANQYRENFAEWLLQQRMEYLVRQAVLTSEETMMEDLMKGFTDESRVLSPNEKVHLALFLDKVRTEQHILYRQGVSDGVQLMKALRKV